MPTVTEFFFSTLKGVIGKHEGAAYTALMGSGCEHVRRWLCPWGVQRRGHSGVFKDAQATTQGLG